MPNLKPLKLHTIIGSNTVWTDELWNAALTYLLERTGTFDALAMTETLYDDYAREYPHKIDYLREFRSYPPTVLLGAFDLMRFNKGTRASADRMMRKYPTPTWPGLFR
jgi:hypothetical protein